MLALVLGACTSAPAPTPILVVGRYEPGLKDWLPAATRRMLWDGHDTAGVTVDLVACLREAVTIWNDGPDGPWFRWHDQPDSSPGPWCASWCMNWPSRCCRGGTDRDHILWGRAPPLHIDPRADERRGAQRWRRLPPGLDLYRYGVTPPG